MSEEQDSAPENEGKVVARYGYVNAKSLSFSLATVRVVLDRLLSNPDNNLYPRVERLLTEPGTTGRVSWDQCMAVQLILRADKDLPRGGTGELTAMFESGELTMPTIGTELYKVLRKANFIIERGRISGVVESEAVA